jgi:hypothetical protein
MYHGDPNGFGVAVPETPPMYNASSGSNVGMTWMDLKKERTTFDKALALPMAASAQWEPYATQKIERGMSTIASLTSAAKQCRMCIVCATSPRRSNPRNTTNGEYRFTCVLVPLLDCHQIQPCSVQAAILGRQPNSRVHSRHTGTGAIAVHRRKHDARNARLRMEVGARANRRHSQVQHQVQDRSVDSVLPREAGGKGLLLSTAKPRVLDTPVLAWHRGVRSRATGRDL